MNNIDKDLRAGRSQTLKELLEDLGKSGTGLAETAFLGRVGYLEGLFLIYGGGVVLASNPYIYWSGVDVNVYVDRFVDLKISEDKIPF
jgi:hypothetical protein